MSVPFFNLSRQYNELAHKIEPAVAACMASCSYIGGKYVTELEEDLARYLSVKHAIAVANGTDALMLALRACNVEPGDEVITTPFTFFATAEAIAAIGGIPVFVDVAERDFNLDPTKLKAAITDKTKAILPVHIFGQPANMDEIRAVAAKYGLKVIEDAAQAIGTEYKGRKTGGLSDMGCFSFYPTKNLGACGDAGMITTNDDDLAVIARALREHGAAKNGAFAREKLYGVKEEFSQDNMDDPLYNPYKYFNYIIGYNSRLDAMQAVVLKIKLEHLDEFNKKRAAVAKYYSQELAGYVLTPPLETYGKSCWHQYAVRVKKKNACVAFLAEKGIGCGEFYPVPLHLQKAFQHLKYREGSLPTAEMLCAQTVCLPIFPELTVNEQRAVVKAVREFAAQEK